KETRRDQIRERVERYSKLRQQRRPDGPAQERLPDERGVRGRVGCDEDTSRPQLVQNAYCRRHDRRSSGADSFICTHEVTTRTMAFSWSKVLRVRTSAINCERGRRRWSMTSIRPKSSLSSRRTNRTGLPTTTSSSRATRS